MLTFRLSAGLATFLATDQGAGAGRSLTMDADDWPGAVAVLRAHYPSLAEHVLTGSGEIRRGFLVAINDVVDSGHTGTPSIRPGDELFLFAQISGG